MEELTVVEYFEKKQKKTKNHPQSRQRTLPSGSGGWVLQREPAVRVHAGREEAERRVTRAGRPRGQLRRQKRGQLWLGERTGLPAVLGRDGTFSQTFGFSGQIRTSQDKRRGPPTLRTDTTDAAFFKDTPTSPRCSKGNSFCPA